MTEKKAAVEVIKENIFTILLVFTMFFAYILSIFELDGALIPNRKLNNFAIFVIFLISGINLEIEILKSSLKNVKLIAWSFGLTFFLYPFIGKLLSIPLQYIAKSSYLGEGFVIATCMPSPASAAVVLSVSLGGDETTAVVISIFNNIVSVIVSPLLIWLFVIGSQRGIKPPIYSPVIKAFLVIIVPICIGQLLKHFIPTNKLSSWKNYLQGISKGMLLFTIYCGIRLSLQIDDPASSSVLAIIFLIICISVIHVGMLYFVLKISSHFEIVNTSQKALSLILSCSMKSLTSGIAIASAITPIVHSIKEYIIPIMLFEPLQVTLASLLGPYIKDHLQIQMENTIV